jgi:drug/metabolite transporter (DMT)-like permease
MFLDRMHPNAQDARARLLAPALGMAIIAISFAAIFFRKAAPTHPLVAAGLRLAVAAVLLLPLVVRAARAGRLPAAVVRAAIAAGIFYGVHFGAWVTSLTLTSVAASVTLVTATPLLLGVLALITGRDRPTRRLWVALALAGGGVTLIGWYDLSLSPAALAGDALALVGAVAMAGYLLVARGLGSAMSLWAFSGIATALGALALLGTAAALGIPIEPASAEAMGYLALAALVPQILGHNLLTWSLRYTTPTVVGIATVGEPVGATALGWIWLGEEVPPLVAAGCGITLSAVMLSLWRPRAPRPPPRP